MRALSYKKFGNMHCIFYRSKILFTAGPHCNVKLGPFFLAFSALVFCLHMVFLFILLVNIPALRILSSILFSVLQLSYTYCGIKDPGIIFPNFEIDLGETGYCPKCGACRGGTHCSLCDVCIAGHDHHCGFIGKCVGQGNLTSFYVLLVSAFTTIIMAAVILGWRTWALQAKTQIDAI